MAASTARCPGCGAPASPEQARCDYCGGALATATCAACFAPMFVGARFCAACGAEATRTDVPDEAEHPCPRCRAVLVMRQLGPVAAHACDECGGLWLAPATLQALCDAREERAAVLAALATRLPGPDARPDAVQYLPCPECRKIMNRTNFARSSGVIVDTCKAHGVWLDRGELPRLLAFVEGGGLAAARDRERERLVEEQRKLAALQARPNAALLSADLGGAMPPNASRLAPTDNVERFLLDALALFLK